MLSNAIRNNYSTEVLSAFLYLLPHARSLEVYENPQYLVVDSHVYKLEELLVPSTSIIDTYRNNQKVIIDTELTEEEIDKIRSRLTQVAPLLRNSYL
jgi:hypothetical protein